MNPSGSFKDNGMSAAFTHARCVGATRAACASTGNTSASLALYCSVTRLMKAVIFVGSGKIAYGKLSQALDYGALTVQIAGDFDDAMARVQEVCRRTGHLPGQQRQPLPPGRAEDDHVPRAGRRSAGKCPTGSSCPAATWATPAPSARRSPSCTQLGLIDRVPRLAVINAAGANTLYELVREARAAVERRLARRWPRSHGYYAEMDAQQRRATTIASAIEINRPVNLTKCLRALEVCDGVVREVTDQEILDAKAQVGAGGLGCEPASAASVAGAKLLVAEGVIGPDERVVCVLTGHQLKDPTATVAYHTTDQEQFNKVLGSRGVRRSLRQPRGGRAQRPRRDHQGDPALQLATSDRQGALRANNR